MADGPGPVDVTHSLPLQSGLGVQLRKVGDDVTSTVGQLDGPRRSIQCDVSAEGVLDDLWEKKQEGLDTVNIQSLLIQEVLNILDDIESSLREDCEEARFHGEVCARQPAVATCRRIAVKIADWLAPSLGLKWAAFGEDTGGVSLVLRSEVTDRRVDFRVSADGLHISAVRIDENLSAKCVPLAVDDRNGLRESAAWVQSRP